MLKCDFHMHSLEDPIDLLDHDAFDLIDHASKMGYHVLSLTLHGRWHYPNELRDYAASKGILLISGIEVYLDRREVLVLGAEEKEVKQLKSLQDLRRLKQSRKDEIFIIAPHPFYGFGKCVGEKLEEFHDAFDGLEFCHFYTKWLNPNERAQNVSQRLKKPMIACSDTHQLKWMRNHYVLLDAPQTQEAVFNALRNGNFQNVTRPLTTYEFVERFCWHAFIQTPLLKCRSLGLISPKKSKRTSYPKSELIQTAPSEVLHR
jgi:predicted metal-dependent phosphoesterase TrpH